jgi:hypothetical protein
MNDAPPTAISELQRWPRWVIWKTEERDGKPTKVPYQPAHPRRKADSTDPETWGTYEQACKAAERDGIDGIGYVFAEDDEYFGIDLDKCVTVARGAFGRAAGPVIHGEAVKIVRWVNSYTEISPNGTGLHIIGRGSINGGRKRTGKTPWGGEFENYDRERFFTVTGQHIAWTPETIEARQDELDVVRAEMFPAAEPKANGKPPLKPEPTTLDDVALEEKIRSSKQGPKFAGLFDRGASEGQESESDLGLCNILAFWLGPDETRIDAWFRRSALIRDKWDSPRGDTTYGGYTINRALEDRTEFYGQKKPAARPKDDNTEMSYAEEISSLFGLIDDPIVQGKRWGRKATAHVVFTTRSGAELDLDSWKASTSTPVVLAQEIGVQLGVEVTLKKENIKRLNVLIGKFCELCAVTTIDDRARDLGMVFLRDAEPLPVDMKDQKERWSAIQKIKDTDPTSLARANSKTIAASSLVLVGKDGRRYVKVQWFIDFVKASAVGSTGAAILERTEKVGWARPNSQGKVKFTNPTAGGEPAYLFEVFYEVPEGWETKDGTGREVT